MVGTKPQIRRTWGRQNHSKQSLITILKKKKSGLWKQGLETEDYVHRDLFAHTVMYPLVMNLRTIT